ncbi:MAG: 5'-nucleotidase C-terminal domain-containing protein [Candidatus Eisenbacteria bacterium]|uniref:5'-nucleotidase C-terminal domain-containing protein n=1 Tax=Eiseniibacteriota bacterium TaxID=2212470 RepID=A0A956NCV7_UNCEI|nr:5'-nucleotidase C-terminal domain-containing protein [Candidatus Eisenbacteria bacterium]
MNRSPFRSGRHTDRAATPRIDVSIVVLLMLIGAFHLLTLGTAHAAGSEVAFRLTLLHSNDGESQLIDAGPGLEEFGGIARFVTKMKQLQMAGHLVQAQPAGDPMISTGVVTVSSGDNFLAGAEFAASLEKGAPFYDTIGLNRVRYDAKAIGNHEFDFGPETTADFIRGFRMLESSDLSGRPTFVSANLDFSGEPTLQALVDAGVIRKSRVVEVGGTRVGIVGATTPRLRYISSPRFVEVDDDVVGTVQAEIDRLVAEEGVTKIIFISHLQSVEEDLLLLPQLHGVDIAVAGGGSELLANEGDLLVPGDEDQIYGTYPLIAEDGDGRNIPVVTTSGDYRYIGRLVVGFDENGEIVEIDPGSGPVRVAGGTQPDAVEPDPFTQGRVVDPVAAFVAELDQNVVATSEVELDGIRNNVRTMETNEGNLCADALLWQATQLAPSFGLDTPQIAFQNGGGIRNNTLLPVGDLTERTTYDILPFANFVSILEDVPATQVKEILENCVSRVEFVDGRFAQVAGLEFVFDPAGTPQLLDENSNVTQEGTRVRELSLTDGTVIVENGVVVSGAPSIDIATIDFLARGGDQYPYRDHPFTTLGVTYQLALRNYLVDGLGGVVTALDYPVGGEGRITELPAPFQTQNTNGSPALATTEALGLEVATVGLGSTRFAFALPATGPVTLTVHDLNGRRIATLFDGVQAAGNHEVVWNGRSDSGSLVASGMYFGRLSTSEAVALGKTLVVR